MWVLRLVFDLVSLRLLWFLEFSWSSHSFTCLLVLGRVCGSHLCSAGIDMLCPHLIAGSSFLSAPRAAGEGIHGPKPVADFFPFPLAAGRHDKEKDQSLGKVFLPRPAYSPSGEAGAAVHQQMRTPREARRMQSPTRLAGRAVCHCLPAPVAVSRS